ncbi:HAMP domain-containing sensor histidine kinase [Desulfosporosinus sp. FKA]|uniref:sensor histidine kinase n=1 Tax=Desulfosporosinus sp. FKA TaxID=1969834 RepID=UPI000B4A1DAD|nr:HAMP domain-containing sensor histidine kinase [Desulfosporosinus sp. FKA]
MKSMMKILIRYTLSAAGVTLVLIVINFTILAAWTVQTVKIAQKDYIVSQLANGLTKTDNIFTLSPAVSHEITKRNQWAMLLDHNGKVIWSENLPSDIPLKYSVLDVAGFTHWYLKDYPVNVWQQQNGLFVLGSEKRSMWKYNIEMPQKIMENILVWIPFVLIFNAIAALLLALLFGIRLFRSLKPLAKGIEDMAEKRPVKISANGLLGDLAAGINQTSAQLAKQEAALNKRDNARTTWIAGVSHDIRTPLSLVMGYASQLENDTEIPLSKREEASIIRRQSERIKTLISDLNLASKLEYDMQPIRKTAVPLSVLLRSIVADFLNSGLDDTYSLNLVISANAQNAVLPGDEELLKRAISNLITNSIRHNPKGCAIKLTLEMGLGNCSLSVSDNGVGFTNEMLNKLNHPKSSARLENHGLGLAIVQQIITVHEGTIEFRNIPNGGCIIVLSLPMPIHHLQV